MSELNIVLLGPPGAGKGTQAARLQEDFRLPYIATGDMLRAHVGDGTDLGAEAEAYMKRGDLVPDELILRMIEERLEEGDTGDGFILDGFPRNRAQAEALDAMLDGLGRRLTAVLFIDTPAEEIVRRISGRRLCRANGHVYHVEFDPPKHEGRCDRDGSELYQRDDDKPEAVRRRLEVYEADTAQLVPFYEERGILRRFDGTRTPVEVHDHIRATLATLRLEEKL